jgi:DNA helicase-2/ATP-dependent DNA helicase PcrA
MIGNILEVAQGIDLETKQEVERKLLRGLNPEQEAVVKHDKGPLLVGAVAGAGKTHALIHRVGYLVVVRGVHPSRVLAVTFSKKGADEMQERLDALIGQSDARIGTFHSLAYEILRVEVPEYREWKVDDRNRYRICLKDAVGYREMDWKAADVTVLEQFVSLCKCDMGRPDSEVTAAIAQKMYERAPKAATIPHLMIRAYALAEDIRRERKLLGFDDMLMEAVELLRDNDDLRRRWASNYDYVLQDEAQDQNLCQLLMGELLAQDHCNYMLVGDPAQCHPPGTKILTDDGYIPIEKLETVYGSDAWSDCTAFMPCQVKTGIPGWNRKSQRLINGRTAHVTFRTYTGPLYKMGVGDNSVEMTENHKVLCRWTNRADRNTCVTYLMYREGFGYRVGHCQLFASSGGNFQLHLAQRAKLEKADGTWIIAVHADRREASIYESIVAAKYGLPTATFEPVHNNKNLDSDAIARIFGAIRDDNESRGNLCLSEHDKHPLLPLLPFPPQEIDRKTEQDVSYRRMTYFPVFACNLLPELMSVPLPDGTNQWAAINAIETRDYDGPVFSLDIKKDHSYVANGIVVLNCIYTWRGARPEKLLGFEKAWDAKLITMNRNYRCGIDIIAAANLALKAMDPATKLDMEMICERKDTPGTVVAVEYNNLDDEGTYVADQIRQMTADGQQPRDFAILYRTNAQSRAPEEALISARIPYRIIGGASFYERKEVKDLLAYLRLAEGRGDLDDIGRCINAPFRFLGRAFVDRVRDAAKESKAHHGAPGGSWGQIIRQVCAQAGLQRRQRDSAADWANMMESLKFRIERSKNAEEGTEAKATGMPARILEDILRETRYTEWLQKDEGEESTENSRVSNIREMVRAAGRFTSVTDLLDYVDKTLAASKKQRKEEGDNPNKVTLCSLHRAKGLEWPNVFLAGASEKILPHGRCEDIEEERRLFYVGVTRARDRLSVSCVANVAFGPKVLFTEPSRFIKEAGLNLVIVTEDEEEPNIQPKETCYSN